MRVAVRCGVRVGCGWACSNVVGGARCVVACVTRDRGAGGAVRGALWGVRYVVRGARFVVRVWSVARDVRVCRRAVSVGAWLWRVASAVAVCVCGVWVSVWFEVRGQ